MQGCSFSFTFFGSSMHVFSLDVFISFVHSRSVSKFTGKTFHHRNGVKAVYVCVLGIVNFQNKWKKKLSYRIIRIKRIFFRSLLMYNLDQVTKFVCEWIGPGYCRIKRIFSGVYWCITYHRVKQWSMTTVITYHTVQQSCMTTVITYHTVKQLPMTTFITYHTVKQLPMTTVII
jgi:hypothetical protein